MGEGGRLGTQVALEHNKHKDVWEEAGRPQGGGKDGEGGRRGKKSEGGRSEEV